jgi:cyanophycinase-like exopeptidase
MTLARVLQVTALALYAVANAAGQVEPEGRRTVDPGVVVLQDRAFELDEAACSRVLGAKLDGPRVAITLRGRAGAPVIDPFARAPGAPSASSPIETFEIDPAVEFAGDRSEIAGRIRAASCVTLAGGDYIAWYTVLTPNGKSSELGRALREAHRSGTIVAGQGAGAAFLARAAITDRASLQREPRNPRRVEPDVDLAGLGLVHGFLVETSTRTKGSLASLCDELTRDGFVLALHLDGEVAWVSDPVSRTAWVEGDGVALLFNAASARRQRDALRTARLSLLRRGDRFDAEHRTVTTLDRGFLRRTDVDAPHERLGATLSVTALVQGLARLAAPTASGPIELGELGEEAHRMVLWTDDNSHFRPAGAGAEFAVAEIAFDLVRAPE